MEKYDFKDASHSEYNVMMLRSDTGCLLVFNINFTSVINRFRAISISRSIMTEIAPPLTGEGLHSAEVTPSNESVFLVMCRCSTQIPLLLIVSELLASVT